MASDLKTAWIWGENKMREPVVVVVPRELYYHEVEYVRRLERLAEAVLLFHGTIDWTPEVRARWKELIGADEATTRSLCEFARDTLKAP